MLCFGGRFNERLPSAASVGPAAATVNVADERVLHASSTDGEGAIVPGGSVGEGLPMGAVVSSRCGKSINATNSIAAPKTSKSLKLFILPPRLTDISARQLDRVKAGHKN